MQQRQILSHHAAERRAEHMCRIDALGVQYGAAVVGVDLHRVAAGGRIGASGAARVEADNPKALGERGRVRAVDFDGAAKAGDE